MGHADPLLHRSAAGNRRRARSSRAQFWSIESEPPRSRSRRGHHRSCADDFAVAVRIDRTVGGEHAGHRPERSSRRRQDVAGGAAHCRRAGGLADARHRPYRAVGLRRRSRRRHRSWLAEARQQLHRWLHHPHRSLDPTGRRDHGGQSFWGGHQGHFTLRGGPQPGWNRSDRAQRNPGRHDRAQPLVHQP